MIRVSLNESNNKKLSVRFNYNAETVERIKKISGSRFVNKKNDKHWTIDYYKIKEFIQEFGVDNLIVDANVDINYEIDNKYDFSHELELFSEPRFVNFSTWALSHAPDKFFSEPAAFNVNHHPEYAHGEGGLSRHTAGAMRICYSLKEIGYYSDEEIDIALTALLIHDFAKYNYGENISEKIMFEHPILACELIEKAFEKDSKEDAIGDNVAYIYNKHWDKIKKAVRSHMGRFNTKEGKELVLPTPSDKISKLVHECDYLSSRNFLEVNFKKLCK